MKKSEYEKYINPKEYETLCKEWFSKGKPKGNDPTYVKVWLGAQEAVKACVSTIEKAHGCKFQDYEEKVLDGTIKVMEWFDRTKEAPRNIVTVAYLPVLGVCCGKKAIQRDFENSMLSLNISIDEDGTTFQELLNIDEDNIACGKHYKKL